MEFFGLTFVMFTGAAVALIGLLVLMFAAFATSVVWGIVSLLIPPLAIGFALTHWSKGKNGFAITMIGLVILAYGSWDNERVQNSQMAQQAEDALRSEPILTPAEPETDVESSPPPVQSPG